MQEITTKPLIPPKGMWAIHVTIPTSNPEKQFIEAEVRKVIAKLGPGIDPLDVNVAKISGEWQGVRHIPCEKSKKWSVEEEYAELYQGTKEAPVILYLHGGAYILASPDTHRAITLRLAKDCGGRVFSLRYRLAPQDPFPAALVDAVLAYKYLLYPPKGALHQPIDPTNIVIAGDSAGVQNPRYELKIGWIGICFDDIPDACGSYVSFTCWDYWDVTMVRSYSFISLCRSR
jgi:hypothetical protein